MTADLEPVDSVVFHTHNVQTYSSVWLNAVQQKKFLDVAGAILGPDIILHHTKLFQKPAEKGSNASRLAVLSNYQRSDDCWYRHVSEATDEMECFRVYPGSHRELGRCEGMIRKWAKAEVHKRYPIEKVTILQAKPGDVVFTIVPYMGLCRIRP